MAHEFRVVCQENEYGEPEVTLHRFSNIHVIREGGIVGNAQLIAFGNDGEIKQVIFRDSLECCEWLRDMLKYVFQHGYDISEVTGCKIHIQDLFEKYISL